MLIRHVETAYVEHYYLVSKHLSLELGNCEFGTCGTLRAVLHLDFKGCVPLRLLREVIVSFQWPMNWAERQERQSWGSEGRDFGQGERGGGDYYYILLCTGYMFESADF